MTYESAFVYHPMLGCPFDDSEMELVEEWRGFTLGMTVEFDGPPRIELGSPRRVRGKILSIGEGAKLLDGTPFTAFAIKCDDDRVRFKTHTQIHHVI